jgi:hypothetical protein
LIGTKGKSPEEMVDNILKGYIKDLQEHQILRFLFEMWCVSRRSEIEKVISAIKKLLEDAGEKVF